MSPIAVSHCCFFTVVLQ
uniref:Uncharacterized protein n=1 Tax=Anguilla anguilla TaxID=7936 RepID=A0A0E9RAT6_ANGAN